ncbi:MAG: hypothetical protein HN576_08465 [Bacteriovoracaceae bacterium]|jgi:hypothetical protein|nr:hypothetical protein [Bacteriovoracaceae bacterium]
MGIPKFKFDQPLKKDLIQLKLTDDDLVSGDFPKEEIFQLKINDVIHGFYWKYDLKDYVQQDTSFEENTYIQKYGETDWVNLFNHPFFQRRKPQLVTKIESSTRTQEYYTLDQGQKMGPFTIEEIKEQVHLKKIILTDMISLNDGHTWGKIYDLAEFERRNETISLPHSPEKNLLSDSHTEDDSKNSIKSSDATEFFARLAYSAKKGITNYDKDITENENENTKVNNKFMWTSIIVFALIAALSLMLTGNDNKNNNLTGNKKVQTDIKNKILIEKRKVLNKTKARSATRDVKASNARKAQQRQALRKNKNRNATPFVRSKTYKKASEARDNRFKEIKNDNENDAFYDNATDPVEQDPVRRTLSKDTFNPAEDDYDFDREQEEEDQYPEEEKEDFGDEEPIDSETNY